MNQPLRLAAALIALSTLASACARDEPQAAAERQLEHDPPAIAATVPADARDGAIYLDVRTAAEFSGGHVQGTLHIPLDQLDGRWAELEPYRDRDIVVYCRSGRRAATAIEMLKAQGFTRLQNGGGLTDMAGRGLTVAR